MIGCDVGTWMLLPVPEGIRVVLRLREGHRSPEEIYGVADKTGRIATTGYSLIAFVPRVDYIGFVPRATQESRGYPARGPLFMDGAPGAIRTRDRQIRRLLLYPLSYGGRCPAGQQESF